MSSAETPGTPPPAGPVTKAQAQELARKSVSGRKPDTEFVILEDQTLEKDFGWVFRYANKEYADTRDPKTLIRGLGPVIVERETGAVHKLPTSLPPDRAIREFEEHWRKAKAGAN